MKQNETIDDQERLYSAPALEKGLDILECLAGRIALALPVAFANFLRLSSLFQGGLGGADLALSLWRGRRPPGCGHGNP